MTATGTPFEIPLSDVRVAEDEIAAAAEALRSGWLTMGPRTAEFEAAFAERHGTRHAIAVANGTAALHLAYLAAGVGPGDEVIVPSYTFVATAAAAVACGATPVFADVLGAHDPSLDPDDVRARITSRTKAVAVVHFAGYAAPADELATICDDRGLALIEDAAHAPRATLHGRHLGTFGRAGCFSLFSNKVLSVGEGGVLVTDDDAAVADSSCYVMPIMLDDARRRDDLCVALRERHGVQTSILYPPAHRFTAYVERLGDVELPRTEDASAREVTIPLYGHLTAGQQERVVAALADALAHPASA
jgi:dTDP-4-amino-4,6-dideoxygalactose transaminase